MRTLLLAACLATAASAATPADRPSARFEQVRAGFANPDMLYAPFAFWFWDEPLNPAKSVQMARTMASQGMNPGYAHPRSTGPGVSPQNPLPPEQWLSPLWFNAFGQALGEAEANHQYLGYVDEYMWPSFQAAGQIQRDHPELRAVSLLWETWDLPAGTQVDLPACAFATAARLDREMPARRGQVAPRLGAWIWQPQPGVGRHTCWLRKTFDLPADATVKAARLRITVDDRYQLFVNGRAIGGVEPWMDVRVWDVAAALRPGRNVIAVEGGGDGGLDALSAGLDVELSDGKTVSVRSDASWRVTTTKPEGWTAPEFDDRAWQPVRVVDADPEAPPWNVAAFQTERHVPAVIRSATLQVIGDGRPVHWQVPADGMWRVYVFHRKVHGSVNYIDERLRKAFLPVAHEPYAQHFPEQMGHSIPGVFVDNEGQYGHWLAWSDTLERRYRSQWHEDIRRWMPLMLDADAEGKQPVARWRWFETVSDLYAETMGSTSRWLEQRGMYCIENLWEESLQWQAAMVGDFFKLSRAYSMPGTDALGGKPLDVHDFKEAGSVAEFEGKRLMNEMMGAGGWGVFTPEMVKRCTNSEIAWGVAHMVPHGVFHNRNLDNAAWTPDWYSENPWFPQMHHWTDFVRRASWVNSHGRQVPDVLLLNPMDTVWADASTGMFDPTAAGDLGSIDRTLGPEMERINRIYSDAIRQLTAHRVEFLCTDRHYLRQMTVRSGRLQRGEFSFGAIVLPPITTLPRDVMATITAFAESGGRVYALGSLPTASVEAGRGDPQMAALAKRLQAAATFQRRDDGLEALLKAAAPGLTPQVAFEGAGFDLLARHVRLDGRDLYWLANNAPQVRKATLTVRGARGAAAIWDCENGATRPVASQPTADGSRLALTWGPLEGYWLVFDPAAPAYVPPPPVERPAAAPVRVADDAWTVRYDAAVQPTQQHPVVPDVTLRNGSRRPLADWKSWGLGGFSGVLDYRATVDLPINGPWQLDLGQCRWAAEVWVNGQSCGSRLWAPFTFDLGRTAKAGPNELHVRVGNLISNSYGQPQPSGLMGPVTISLALNR